MFFLLYLSGINTQALTNCERRELLFTLFILISRFSGENFPSRLYCCFALCRKDIISIRKFNHAFVVPERLTDRTKQAGGNQPENCLFTLWQIIQAAFYGFFGGDNGVVVRNFLVIDNLRRMNRNVFHILHRENVEKRLYQFRKHILHVTCQITAVSTGISDQFFSYRLWV